MAKESPYNYEILRFKIQQKIEGDFNQLEIDVADWDNTYPDIKIGDMPEYYATMNTSREYLRAISNKIRRLEKREKK